MLVAGLCSLMAMVTITGALGEISIHPATSVDYTIVQEEGETPPASETAGDNAARPASDKEPTLQAPSRQEAAARDELKEQIKQEVLRELIAERQSHAVSEKSQVSASGKILWKDQPLADCRVKAVRLEKLGFGSVRLHDTGQEIMTAADGSYAFEQLEPGFYKIYWVPPDGTHWIRRLRNQPDFEVQPGERTEIEPLEIAVSTLN